MRSTAAGSLERNVILLVPERIRCDRRDRREERRERGKVTRHQKQVHKKRDN
jgi:hypothetical protein